MTRPKTVPRSKDFDIRAGLVRALLHYGLERRQIRHELPLDTYSSDGRADIVILGHEALIGAEIKSGSDTFDRLVDQAESYGCRFDDKVLVKDIRHREKAAPGWNYSHILMDWDGAISTIWRNEHLDQRNQLSALLDGTRRQWVPRRQSPVALLSLLHCDEVEAAAAWCGFKVKTRHRAISLLAQEVPLKTIRRQVIAMLGLRELNRWEKAFWTRFDALDQSEVAA
jgi:hypothetical protein